MCDESKVAIRHSSSATGLSSGVNHYGLEGAASGAGGGVAGLETAALGADSAAEGCFLSGAAAGTAGAGSLDLDSAAD